MVTNLFHGMRIRHCVMPLSPLANVNMDTSFPTASNVTPESKPTGAIPIKKENVAITSPRTVESLSWIFSDATRRVSVYSMVYAFLRKSGVVAVSMLIKPI